VDSNRQTKHLIQQIEGEEYAHVKSGDDEYVDTAPVCWKRDRGGRIHEAAITPDHGANDGRNLRFSSEQCVLSPSKSPRKRALRALKGREEVGKGCNSSAARSVR